MCCRQQASLQTEPLSRVKEMPTKEIRLATHAPTWSGSSNWAAKKACGSAFQWLKYCGRNQPCKLGKRGLAGWWAPPSFPSHISKQSDSRKIQGGERTGSSRARRACPSACLLKPPKARDTGHGFKRDNSLCNPASKTSTNPQPRVLP